MNKSTKLPVSDDKARFVCPHCYFAKEIAVAQFRNSKKAFKIKCKCGESTRVELDFREYRRKDTNLEGTFKAASGAGWPVDVINISMVGVAVEVRGAHSFQVGYKGTVSFRLDDRKQSHIVQKVVIRSVTGNRLGCEFVSDRLYQKELGFYLRA